jgi:hypothetical protein
MTAEIQALDETMQVNTAATANTTTTTTTTKDGAAAAANAVDYGVTATELDQANEIVAALSQEEIDILSDDFMTLRHLRAEKGNVGKAIAAVQRTLKWRKEFLVDELKTCLLDASTISTTTTTTTTTSSSSKDGDDDDLASILRQENESGKLYVRGYDKDGRALLYMRPGKENTNQHVNNMRHLVYHMEKAVACSASRGQSKICIVIDYDGFKLRHAPPMSTSRFTLDVLQKHYPERLHRGYICNPPWIFQGFWKLVYPFIDPVTKQKICFCTSSKDFQKVMDDMGGPEQATHLEECAGGTHPTLEFNSSEYLTLPLDVTFGEDEH